MASFVRRVDGMHVLCSDGWVHRCSDLPPPSATSHPTTSTKPPKKLSRRPPARRSPCSSKALVTRRAKQRWSALVSAPTSRLARYMRPLLGHRIWNAFVKHANACYKDRYVSAFAEQPLECVGPLDGTGCPHAFRVDLSSPEAPRMLAHLHLDHDHPIHQTCSAWCEELPPEPQSWDDGIDGRKLCHFLFGVSHDPANPPCLHFRCGPRRTSGKTVPYAQHTYCHTS